MSDKTLLELMMESLTLDCIESAEIFDVKCDDQKDCSVCKRAVFSAIADAIEREYLPRPRFEDGEPVQFGDKFESAGIVGTVDYILKGNVEGCVIGRKEDRGCVTYPNGKRVKRPAPEVLDADGVPIKVGDTVYFVLDQEPLRVVGIDNYGFVICEGKKDCTFPHPDVLTHKQPDSLERIEGDALKAPRAYWGCYDTRCDFCPAKIDEGKKPYERYPGVTDCTSAQALDLLRRQREVLERGR